MTRSTLLRLSAVASVAMTALVLCQPDASARTSGRATTQAAADAVDQCSVALADRTGAWVCPPDPATTAATAHFKSGSRVTPYTTIGDGGGGWCAVQGNGSSCYTRSSGNTVTDANVSGQYGYGSRVLGSVWFTVQWRLNGHQLARMSGTWSSTGTVDAFYYEAALDRVTSNSNGASVGSPQLNATTSPEQPVISGGHTYSWTAPAWFNNAYSNYTGEIAPSWEVSGYPGYWWMNVRSPIYHCASKTSACYFTGNLPAGAFSAGWD